MHLAGVARKMRMHEFEQTDRRSQWPSFAGAEDVMCVLRAAKPADAPRQTRRIPGRTIVSKC